MTPEQEHRQWAEETFGPENVHDGRLSVIYLAKWIVEGRGYGRYSGRAQDEERTLEKHLGGNAPSCLIIALAHRPEFVQIDSLDGIHSYNVARSKEGEVFRFLSKTGGAPLEYDL